MAETTNKSKHRRLIKNSETFREKAKKASADKDKPSSSKSNVVVTPIKKALSPLSKAIFSLFNQPPLKYLKRPLRLIAKILVPSYFRSSWRELKQVTWPGWKQGRRLTFAVIAFAVIFGAVIAGVDWGLDKIFRNLLLK